MACLSTPKITELKSLCSIHSVLVLIFFKVIKYLLFLKFKWTLKIIQKDHTNLLKKGVKWLDCLNEIAF